MRTTTACLVLAALLGPGCGARVPAPAAQVSPAAGIDARIAADLEAAVRAGQAGWEALFDFETVGVFEILLRRYDLLGRLPDLTEAERADLARDDGTPYPAARERRNVGRFYPVLGQRTVGSGGCAAVPLRWNYNRLLGTIFPPLPPGHEAYEPLRVRINGQLERGGVVGVRCRGGTGGLALVWSARPSARGYDLITIYDDGE